MFNPTVATHLRGRWSGDGYISDIYLNHMKATSPWVNNTFESLLFLMRATCFNPLLTALDTHPLQQATRTWAWTASKFSMRVIANTLLKPPLINDHLWFSAASQFGVRINEAEEQHKLFGRET